MYKAFLNQRSWEVEVDSSDGLAKLNGQPLAFNQVVLDQFREHLITDEGAFHIEWLGANPEEKSFRLRVNGKETTLVVKDSFDLLLEQMGLDNLAAAKVQDVKAPMPGLVLSIAVSPGQEVKKGDALIILEAMKMENVLKSPADGKVKEVLVTQGQAVEKNLKLITFDL